MRFPANWWSLTDRAQSDFLAKYLWRKPHSIGTGGYLTSTSGGTRMFICGHCDIEVKVKDINEAFEHIESETHKYHLMLGKLGQ